MRRLLFSGVALIALAGAAAAAPCPAVTVNDMKGVAPGAFPQQYELSEYEAAANCTMEFSSRPDDVIAAFNAEIQGNPELPPLSERLPKEPLVVAPYDSIGSYGGTLDIISNATEAGTSDMMSIRHVNLVRYSDDLETIVPNVAKGWKWNDDYTQLTFYLREGHKWSDGEPFTSADIKFWYDNLELDPNVIASTKDYVLVGGERMTVETPDPYTVVFNLPSPKPGLLSHFANHYAQAFQPKHLLGKYHPAINPDADAEAQKIGFETGYDVIKAYYGNSDWMDTPTPMLANPDKVANMPFAAAPTLESHIVISESTEGRRFVPNPYYFKVDTTGQQLPYVDRMDETFVTETEVRVLKLINGEVDYKTQSLQLDMAPILLENQEKGDYTVWLRPKISFPTFSFNVTDEDPEKRELFNKLAFREAMSVAINRAEINEVAYFGLGEIQQYVAFSPTPSFIDEALLQYKTEYDPEGAKAQLDGIGLTDQDGDGWRDLPSGKPLVLNVQFATQGMSAKVAELVAQHWADVGVKTTVKEITADEYRSAQSSNALSVGAWEKSQPLGVILGNNELFVPPFENYFAHRTGMLWAEYLESKGANGVEPPAWVNDSIADINAFQSAVPGSDEQNEIGSRMVERMVKELMFIGTVKAVSPVFHRNALKNVPEFKTASYDYYWAYPYRGDQWWLDE
ncbi:MAG TPA: ABC transporter substrate-binding protein [Rhodobacteraceae bacterium]|nr:ABC transporter substrate-binding protein [Paracoccaceae bacterium]